MTFPNSNSQDIKEIVEAITGLAELLEDDLVRRACEGGEPFLTEPLEGCVAGAIKHLSSQAVTLSEMVVNGEEGI